MKDTARKWYSLPVRQEIEESRKLWEEIFTEDSEGFLDYYDQWKVSDNWIQTRHSAGRLVSMIHWNPYRVYLRDRVMDSAYLVAVSTLPEYRHRGMMRGLIRSGLAQCREEGMPFVFLMPADPAIYTPFGFRYFYSRREAVIEQPMQQNWNGADEVDIRPLRRDEYAAAAEFLKKELSERFELYPCRTEEYLIRTAAECQSEEGDLEGIYENGHLVGCLDWWGDKTIEIREIILTSSWENEGKWSVIRAAMCKRWRNAEKISLITTGWLGEAKPIIMGRIVNLEKFLSVITADQDVKVHLWVEDPLLAENQGEFIWNIGPWGSFLERRKEECSEETEIRINIEDMFSWLTGTEEITALKSAVFTTDGREKAGRLNLLHGAFFTEIV